MGWRIEYARSVRKDIQKLDPQDRRRIREFLEQRVSAAGDPRQLGRPLKGRFSEAWRYRVGDYRIVCKLDDEVLTVLVIRVGHRRQVYR